jgi:hypothetical protein
MQLDSQYLHCIQKAPTQGVGRTKPHPERFDRLVEGISLARNTALIYNWWTIFVRLAKPGKHLEAISSRPLLLHAIGKQVNHSGQTFIKITSTHGRLSKVKKNA